MPDHRVGAFVAANLLGSLLLGHFFATVGRRRMIAGTYLVSGLILTVAAVMQLNGG